MRHDGRAPDELRPIALQRGYTKIAPGSVLIEAGKTIVLCTASIDENVPEWMQASGKGWITAEYNMLPGSTSPRKRRERGGKVDGRTSEIQRLIGRSLRAVVDFEALGPRTIFLDCDVLQADGGTRTASITGAFVALVDALATLELPPPPRPILRQSVAAVSVGVVDGTPVLDLDYREDSAASVDMNIVMTGNGEFIELQGTGEGTTFSEAEMFQLIGLGKQGIEALTALQKTSLEATWPLDA